jgi:hypothetical protein
MIEPLAFPCSRHYLLSKVDELVKLSHYHFKAEH